MISSDYEEVSTMAELSEQDLSPRRYQRGEIVAGEVVRVDDDGIEAESPGAEIWKAGKQPSIRRTIW